MTYTITTTLEGKYTEGGTVTIDGESAVGTVTLEEHSSVRLIISPRRGYKIDTVAIDDRAYGEVESITINDITESHTIAVLFGLRIDIDVTDMEICPTEDSIYVDPPDDPPVTECCEVLQREIDALRDWITEILGGTYEGPYTVTPRSRHSVILGTNAKLMTDDVTVLQTPYYETSNESGITVYIGGND